ALIGAHFDDIGLAQDQGSAYLFSRAAVGWAPRQRLMAQGGGARELFGQAVALSGGKAVVGAPHAKVGENLAQGAVYLFGCGYAEQTTFAGVGPSSGDYFAETLAMDGDTAVVGAPLDDVGTKSNQGSAYV